jgi:BirA family transcriptional regulator, biotin operon repressor / biotin---[acetyl-CoA-carboxylase] ligase
MSSSPAFEIRRFEQLDSTNRYLVDEAANGAREGLVAVADYQSAGRGRLGRSWEAPPGAALLVSVLLRPSGPTSSLPLATVLVALSARRACAEVAGVAPDLKWPNDLVVGDAKVGGVLAELADVSVANSSSPAVVVGTGINVSWPGPPGVGGTSLEAACGHRVERERLLDAFLTAVADDRALLDTGEGRAGIVAGLRAHCCTLGRAVRVRAAGEEFEGEATDVDDAGRLIVATAAGPRTVHAGDVTVRPL